MIETTETPELIVARDLSFVGILHDIKKSNVSFQPIFEAFTNAIEAIKIRQREHKDFVNGKIEININVEELTDENYQFKSISIKDNGIGFNIQEFSRFNIFKDNSKGFKNLGSGRIQYVHYFDKTEVKSVFRNDGQYFEREFILSKRESFLSKNALVKLKYLKLSRDSESYTKIVFKDLLETNNSYNTMTDFTLKQEILKRYIHYLCFNADNIPEIHIRYFIMGVKHSESKITKKDIPTYDKKESVNIPYKSISEKGDKIVELDKAEEFELTTFKLNKELLGENDIKLISKGEVVEGTKIALTGIAKNDSIKSKRYLVLVSGNYIDTRDSNIRGQLDIPLSNNYKAFSAFNTEIIFLDDIQQTVNNKLSLLYPEIKEVNDQHNNDLRQLREMFLIDDDTSVEISINDDEKKILEKFYEAQAKKEAKIDATIKETIDKLDELDTTSTVYEDEFEKKIQQLVKIIPEQNRRTLSHYVARRKLVLELFDKILNKKLKVQNSNGREKEEALIHNLLFRQKDNNTLESDLWIINEEFIYFKGSSESKLIDLKLDDKKVFRDKFEEEENKYLLSLGQNRLEKRPDVLLFPEEGKCIIIEFKSPRVNVSDHLTQINKYAFFIRNYTNKEFEIKTFYGYLIGEGIEVNDVLGSVSSFENSYHFDYLYSPSQKVIGIDGNENGSIYTEVIKYSSLLRKAKMRNSIFIEKLGL